ERHEESAAANVTNVRMIAEAGTERAIQIAAKRSYPLDQAVALDDTLHGKRRGGSDRVADVRVAVLEHAAAVLDRFDDTPVSEHGADGLIAAAEALRDSDQVGHDALLLDRVQRPGASHAAHHFVADQQRAAAI